MEFGFFLSSNNSSGSSVKTADSMNNSANNDEFGSLLFVTGNKDDSGFDGFGGKDLFGNPDVATLEAAFLASGPQTETIGSMAAASTETIGSLACATGSDFSVGGGECVGASAGAGASVGGDCGSSGGGCSFVG